MNAAEHYKEGERYVQLAKSAADRGGRAVYWSSLAQTHFAAAQVGATLAASISGAWFNVSQGPEMALYNAAVEGQ